MNFSGLHPAGAGCLWKCIQDIQVFFFGEQVAIVLSFIGTDTRLDHHETFVVDDGSPVFGAHTQQVPILFGNDLKYQM